MLGSQEIADDLKKLRAERPLVHSITNYVVMNWTANCLLSVGASPVMGHAPEEVEELIGISRSLVVNIGTLSGPWIESMEIAMKAARERDIPVVVDPVGVGATQFRTNSVRKLLESAPPTVIRGNASEILALAGDSHDTRGVDSTQASQFALESARKLSRQYACVVCVSGRTDLVVNGSTTCLISNGHPVMTRVTGMGCAATALIGALLAVQSSPVLATASAMAIMGIVGELAAAESMGPGSFQSVFLDRIYLLDEPTLRNHLKVASSGDAV